MRKRLGGSGMGVTSSPWAPAPLAPRADWTTFRPGYARRVSLRRLHPDPREVTAEEVTTGLRLGDHAPPDRPYLVVNMVETLDGRIAIDGRSGSIGNPADREIFHGLRTQADAIMAGAGTGRTERYGRMIK